MNMKHVIALMGMLFVLGAGLVMAQEKKAGDADKVQIKTQAQTRTATQEQAATQVRTRARLRTQFIDQDGDGISDLSRDSDNDGIPNCQDPDWTRPEDGTGLKAQKGAGGNNTAAMAGGHKKSARGKSDFSNRSFRNSRNGAGTCCPGCSGTGTGGRAVRKGRG